jgi:hypothetical protein
VKYAFMAQCREEFPVVLMSRVLSVSRAGFYAWLKRGPALQRAGVARAYKYKFKNAIMRPYVIMQGLETKLISEELMTQLAS